MNTPELSPCPFCGGTASLARCGFGTGRVTCSDCGAEGQYRQTHDEAISAWNTRASPAPGRAPLTGEQVAVLQFLFGVGDLDGCGFGDRPHGERGMYWWRKHLRTAFPGIAPAGGIGGDKP